MVLQPCPHNIPGTLGHLPCPHDNRLLQSWPPLNIPEDPSSPHQIEWRSRHGPVAQGYI
jgi:hypothetical protein